MPVLISSFLAPRSAAIPFLIDDKLVRGGHRTLAAATELADIPASVKKTGMTVHCEDVDKTFKLLADGTWQERQELTEAEKFLWSSKPTAQQVTDMIASTLAGLPAGGGATELPPTGALPGYWLEHLASGMRWTNTIDGGNALGVVSGLPSSGYGGTGEVSQPWTAGQLGFAFTGTAYTPSLSFAF